MTSTNQVPADMLVFTININAEGETPREVYELHKQRESLLAKLLKDMEVKDEEISFQPVSFSTRSQGRNTDPVSVSNQQVTVRFTDFDLYEELQITLISNGFDQLRAQFSSTEIQAAKQQALADAIAEAKKKAEFIAKESGVELGEVLTMNYSDQVMQPYKRSMDEVVVSGYSSAPSMMDFSPTLSVGASISITFLLK
jgi:uncharacterized protein YggE